MRQRLKVSKLNDEFGNYRLTIRCRECGRSRVCDPAELAARVGWECSLEQLAARLRCSTCGAKHCEFAVQPRPHERTRQVR